MITTLHTLSLASITHHINSPHVRLRRPPRPPELRQSARPPVLAARCPTIARHPPPGPPPAASAMPAASAAAGHERDARRWCQSRETVAIHRRRQREGHPNRNFLPCSLCKIAREENFLIWVWLITRKFCVHFANSPRKKNHAYGDFTKLEY
jgi:hypothetical protein